MKPHGKRPLALNPLEREAHDWVRRLGSGRATLADTRALQQWRNSSPAHVAALRKAQDDVWHKLGAAGHQVFRDPLPDVPYLADADLRAPDPRRRALLGAGITAAAAAVTGVAVWPSLLDMRADFRTGTGEQREVMLNGDVRVALNTQTRIAVRPDAGTAGGIELIGGETAVDLARVNGEFVVLAGSGRGMAQGGDSRFEVRNTGGPVCVTCLSGRVRVDAVGQSMLLQANQLVTYDARGIGAATDVDPAGAAGWREGVLVFRQTPLDQVVTEINRYRPGQVVLLNDEKARLPLSGRFRLDDMDRVLLQIRQAFEMTARALPGGIVLLS